MGNVLYFLGILLSFIVNAAMWQLLGSQWMEIPEGFPQASEIIAGCRLVLHIRSAPAPTPHTTGIFSTAVEIPMERFPFEFNQVSEEFDGELSRF
ncbi:hypothetical protein HYDPIDRAFT_114409 [Hydnomerulius pinastri MD-312]|uniref:Uncharacterized protein n=1 Tax=Hydnomerulius pinastri MD-312 TaxID=994086 RepID=A0A0C9W6V8_9AGAM|nr:hypothetical protein HYDPIDRAFT_114409 [Hydnomerulius pinastri MD-312]